MSLFDELPHLPADRTFALMEAFKNDKSEKKVNLTPGIYRDDNENTWVLHSVKKAREMLLVDPELKHDISPQLGHPGLVAAARHITFKETLSRRHVASMQTISGTGANHLVAKFLSDTLQPKTVWLSNLTWENHGGIWSHVNSSISQKTYPYFDGQTNTLDGNGLVSTLREQASCGDVMILQACAHNPTGLDPSRELWEDIASVCEEKGIFPIFDSAYQGFATGEPDNDGWPMRHFATRSHADMEFAVAQSFSKNFGLYGERVGALHVVTRTADSKTKVESMLKKISRAEITSCPGFGAKLVATIIQTPELKEQWHRDLKTMSSHLRQLRQRLHDELVKRGTPGNWGHILTDIGMFSMTGLSQEKIAILKDAHHIYLLPSGRLSLTGLTSRNVEYVAESIHRVVTA